MEFQSPHTKEMESIPEMAKSAVLVKTSLATQHDDQPDQTDRPKDLRDDLGIIVQGYDFNEGLNYERLMSSFTRTGFQATSLGLAVDQINAMLEVRRNGSFELDQLECDPFIRRRSGCTLFLGYTSNLVSSGIRETIRYLVQHRLVDCVVTTAGGVEEDIIKCLAPTFVGDFALKGADLRSKGINRIGNLLVPNDNYCLFEDWLMPLLDQLLERQKTQPNCIWSPSKIIEQMGLRIDDPTSICYWAARNQIPVFCPALIDGSFGDMLYFHTYRNPGLIVDIAQDIRRVNSIAVKAARSGVIVLGGGVVKHHICNANLMRNGADFAVFVNTGNEFDGSDAGARPDEAVSWGKIRADARPVKVHCDASIAFPLLVAQTFAKFVAQNGSQALHEANEESNEAKWAFFEQINE